MAALMKIIESARSHMYGVNFSRTKRSVDICARSSAAGTGVRMTRTKFLSA